MKKLLLVSSLVLLQSCGSMPTAETYGIAETEEAWVKTCEEKGQVHGSSYQGGLFAQDIGLQRAKNEALEKARNLNANRIIWNEAKKGFFGASARGTAYYCQVKS